MVLQCTAYAFNAYAGDMYLATIIALARPQQLHASEIITNIAPLHNCATQM
jgi:hypothetical protein